MKESQYQDKVGRWWKVLVPDNSKGGISQGIPIGPPSLEGLGLPESIEIAIHNELFARRIFISVDIKRNRADVLAAIQGALKIDSQKILDLYLNWESVL